VGWEQAKLARKCLQAPRVVPNARLLGVRARGQQCNTAVCHLSSPGFSGFPGLHCSSQEHPSGSCCLWWVLFHEVSLFPAPVIPDLSQLCTEMLEHPRCPGWGVYSRAVPGNGELMVLLKQHQSNQKRELQTQSIPQQQYQHGCFRVASALDVFADKNCPGDKKTGP